MAALTAVGAYLQIPIGPVPIVLSTLFVLLSGLLLGSRWGLVSMALYLLIGAIGLPVFSGGRGGVAHFFGPTGGYLFGYCLSAWITGLISERSRKSPVLQIMAVVVGSLAIYRGGSLAQNNDESAMVKGLHAGHDPFSHRGRGKRGGGLYSGPFHTTHAESPDTVKSNVIHESCKYSGLRLRSPFRLESSGYMNFLRPRPLPNDDRASLP